jgi:hypothetical protein
MNMFVAVIYEEFSSVKETDDDSTLLTLKKQDIDSFVHTWTRFDPDGTHYIKTKDLPRLLQSLSPPLGYRGGIESSRLAKVIYCLNIRDRQGRVYFPEVMWSIFFSVMGNNEGI